MLADPAALGQLRPAWTPAGRESMWGRRRAAPTLDGKGRRSRVEAVIAGLGGDKEPSGGGAAAKKQHKLGHAELLRLAAETHRQ